MLLLALAHVFAVSTAAQSASPVNLAAVDEETMRHFQALVRMDTSDPPGNEVPAVEYLARNHPVNLTPRSSVLDWPLPDSSRLCV